MLFALSSEPRRGVPYLGSEAVEGVALGQDNGCGDGERKGGGKVGRESGDDVGEAFGALLIARGGSSCSYGRRKVAMQAAGESRCKGYVACQ